MTARAARRASPAFRWAPAEGIFDAPPVGTAACCVYTNLYNNTKASLTISSVVPSGDFALQFNNCPSTLGAGGSCSYGVNFTPTAGGIRTGKRSTNHNDPS